MVRSNEDRSESEFNEFTSLMSISREQLSSTFIKFEPPQLMTIIKLMMRASESAGSQTRAKIATRQLSIPKLRWLIVCCDLKCDFLLLKDVKKWMSYQRLKLQNLITTLLSNPHFRILSNGENLNDPCKRRAR